MSDNDAVYEFSPDTILVSKTDPRGVITYANAQFCKAANLSPAALVGKPHATVRHPDMPRAAFAMMWAKLQAAEEFFAVVVNKREGGGCYWVLAHVVPDIDPDSGEVLGFHSSRRWVSPSARREAERVYALLRAAEAKAPNKSKAAAAGRAALDQLLADAGQTYEQWVMSLAVQTGR
jgi:PAS domain S-box-containing protein